MAFYYETGNLKYVGTISQNLSDDELVSSRFEISSFFRGSAPNQWQLSATYTASTQSILLVSNAEVDKYALMRVRLSGQVDKLEHLDGSGELSSSYRMTAVTFFAAGSLAGGHVNQEGDDYEHFCPLLVWTDLSDEWNVGWKEAIAPSEC